MKTFLAAIICFFVIIILLFFYVNFISTATSELISDLEKVEYEVLSKNWGKSQENFSVFYNNWDKKKNTICIFVDHSVIDPINENISALNALLKAEDDTESKAKISTIKTQLGQLSENEKPIPLNIIMAR